MLREMTPSPDAIAEFQRLYQEEYGAALTVGEAQIKARQLLELFKVLTAPQPKPDKVSFESLLSNSLHL
jgi:hypothetical protein